MEQNKSKPSKPKVVWITPSNEVSSRLSNWVRTLEFLDFFGTLNPDQSLNHALEENIALWIIGPETFDQPDDLLHFIENLKQISPLGQIIVLTHDPRIEVAVATIKHGAEEYIKLPVSQQTLEKAIQHSLDQSTLLEHHHELSDFWVLLQNCQQISASTELDSILEIVSKTINRILGTADLLLFETTGKLSLPSSWVLRPNKKGSVHPESEMVQKTLYQQFKILLKKELKTDFLNPEETFYKIIPAQKSSPAHLFFTFENSEKKWIIFSLFPDIKTHPRVLDQYLKVLHSQVQSSLQSLTRNQNMEHLAYRDPLTELPNLRALHAQIQHSIQQDAPFGVIFIDIDGFKIYNDQKGHPAGDLLLKQTAQCIQKMIRETDNLFRYAGDEFVALLYPCDSKTAFMVAERIRAAVQKTGITVSLGLALYPDDLQAHSNTDMNRIIQLADEALYLAKSSGKNKVIRYNQSK